VVPHTVAIGDDEGVRGFNGVGWAKGQFLYFKGISLSEGPGLRLKGFDCPF
jgi:hypothetical protein